MCKRERRGDLFKAAAAVLSVPTRAWPYVESVGRGTEFAYRSFVYVEQSFAFLLFLFLLLLHLFVFLFVLLTVFRCLLLLLTAFKTERNVGEHSVSIPPSRLLFSLNLS